MNEAFALIEKVRLSMSVRKEFNYWDLLHELEALGEKIPDVMKGLSGGNFIKKGRLFLDDGSVIKEGTIIEGNAFIGKNCVIGPNAYLRKNVVIGNDCHVANSEIKNSILMDGTSIAHFSYVGDSVIGERVNFGAGAKIANLRFDDGSISVQVMGKRVDSGRRKLGALIKSGTKIGINACIDCGVIVGKDCFIFPGATVSKNLPDGTHFRG